MDWCGRCSRACGGAQVVLVPNKYMETPAYEIRRLRDDEVPAEEIRPTSYQLAQQPTVDVNAVANRAEQKPVAPQAAVTTIMPAAPAPATSELVSQVPPERVGIFVALWRFFFGGTASGATDTKEKPSSTPPRRHERSERPQRGGRHERNDRRGNRGRDRNENRDEKRTEPARNEARPEQRNEPRRDDRQRDEQRKEHHVQRQREQQERRRERDAQHPAPNVNPPVQGSTSNPEAIAPVNAQANTQADAFPADGQQGEQRRGRRNRRRRGGRGRGGEGRPINATGENTSANAETGNSNDNSSTSRADGYESDASRGDIAAPTQTQSREYGATESQREASSSTPATNPTQEQHHS